MGGAGGALLEGRPSANRFGPRVRLWPFTAASTARFRVRYWELNCRVDSRVAAAVNDPERTSLENFHRFMAYIDGYILSSRTLLYGLAEEAGKLECGQPLGGLRMNSHFSRYLRIGASATLALLLSVGGASAATLQVVGGSPFTLQSNFNPAGWSNPDGIGVGTSITIFNSTNASSGGLEAVPSSGPVSLTFTYFGFEAAYTNDAEGAFSFGGTPMFVNQTTPLGTSVTMPYTLTSPGLIPFLFASTGYSPTAVATNGGPINPNVELGFVIDPDNSSIAYAFFEDIAINGDQDFDDMVVKIQINATPLPAALPLFAGGLGAMGLLGWRRKRKPAAIVAA